MTDRVRWGILGCASIARRRVIPALVNEADNAHLYAVASRNEAGLQRVAEFQAEKAYASYEEMLADPKVDAVYIPLPNALHMEWAIAAMRAKKHVLCEKPLALSVSQIERMEEASKENNVLLMEAFACLHTPLYPAILDMIDQGEIGAVRVVNAAFHYLDVSDSVCQHYALGGGGVYDVGCYNILTIRQLCRAEPRSVIAVAEKNASGVDVSCYAVLDMGDGVDGVSQCGMNAARRCVTSVLGEKGFIRFERTPNAWGTLRVELNNEKGHHIVELECPKASYALEIEQFGRCIAGKEQPRMSLEESKKNMAAMEMVLREIKY